MPVPAEGSVRTKSWCTPPAVSEGVLVPVVRQPQDDMVRAHLATDVDRFLGDLDRGRPHLCRRVGEAAVGELGRRPPDLDPGVDEIGFLDRGRQLGRIRVDEVPRVVDLERRQAGDAARDLDAVEGG
jgi:hypothetical protein